MTLAEFLLSRYAEDEAVARVAIGKLWEPVTDDHGRKGTEHSVWAGSAVDGRYVAEVVLSASSAEHIARWDPARVLAECEAKRRIVRPHAGTHECPVGETSGGYWDDVWPCDVLRLLALPFADHEDFREDWRP